MNPDILFNRLEQRTERELFRRSFKAAADSQDSMFKKFENRKREQLKVTIAKEVKWFLITIILAPVIGFVFFYAFANLMQETMIELAIFFNGVETLFLVISGITFLGIYVARRIIWALKQ